MAKEPKGCSKKYRVEPFQEDEFSRVIRDDDSPEEVFVPDTKDRCLPAPFAMPWEFRREAPRDISSRSVQSKVNTKSWHLVSAE